MANIGHDKLVEIVCTLLEIEPDQVTESLSPETVEQWDSLNHLNICVAVGQEYNFELTTNEMAEIRNLGDLARLIEARQG